MHKPLTIALVLLAATAAAELAPYQQVALDRILATMDAESQQYAQPQLEAMLATMNEAQVNMIVQSMLEQAPDNPQEEEEPADVYDTVATPEDLEYNRRQFEPALREAWRAGKEFDEFVDATLAARCPAAGAYAVYGSAWRYEPMAMQPYWTRTSNSADIDVQVLGSSYAPQDGRYRFDFSGARNTFDRNAVDGAITRACNDYRAIGEEFLASARRGISNGFLPNGDALENAANARVSPLVTALGEQLQALAPTGNATILNALLNGTRVN